MGYGKNLSDRRFQLQHLAHSHLHRNAQRKSIILIIISTNLISRKNNLFQRSEQVLQKYLKTLYGEGDYELIYTAENAYPEYADDKTVMKITFE